MAKSRASKQHVAVGLLQVLVVAYTKIRVLVRQARQEKWTQEDLVDSLCTSLSKHEARVLERVSRSFYTSSGSLTQKRLKQGWGNVRKVWDRLHLMLSEEVGKWTMPRGSKNRWSQLFLRRVLVECFRARAVAHTSARYDCLRQGHNLSRAVSSDEMAWSLYGSKATKISRPL